MIAAPKDFHEACLVALSLSPEPMNRTTWANWLGQLTIRLPPPSTSTSTSTGATRSTGRGKAERGRQHDPRGRRVAAGDLRGVVEYGQKAGLLQPFDSGGELFHIIAQRQGSLLGAEKHRPLLGRLSERLAALVAQSGRTYSFREEQNLFNMQIARARLALYRGAAAEVDAIVAEIDARSDYSFAREDDEHTLLDVVPLGSTAADLARLSPASQATYLEHAMPLWFSEPLLPDPDILTRAMQLDDPRAQALRSPAAMLLALGPGVDPSALADDDSAFGLQARAVIALRAGDFERTRALTRAALEHSRGASKRRKPYLTAPLAPLLTLVLATGDSEDRAAAHLQLLAARKKRRSSDEHCAAHYVLSGAQPLEQPDVPWDYDSWQRTLTLLLSIHFAGVPPQDKSTTHPLREAAQFLHDKLQESGLGWLARQSAALIDAFTGRAAATLAREPAEARPLTSLKTVHAAWERSLERLERVLSAPAESADPSADESSERLVFLAQVYGPDGDVLVGRDLHGQTDAAMPEATDPTSDSSDASDEQERALLLHVEPRLQKRSAKGWTKGRPVALRTLLEQEDKLSYLTAEDKRVVRTIAVRRDWYGERTYEFGPRMPVALIGHPRVWPAGAVEGPALQVVAAMPTLEVREANPGVLLAVSPRFNRHGIGLQIDPQGRLSVCQAHDTQKQALAAIERLPVIPESGRERLNAVLAPLASHFTVHSQAATAVAKDMTEVDADASPVVHLMRTDSGLLARVIVQPLGKDGPSLQPGRGLSGVSAEIAGVPTHCTRDLAAERLALAHAAEVVPELLTASQTALNIDAWEDCLELLERLNQLQGAVRVLFPDGEPIEVLAPLDNTSVRLQFAEKGDWLSVTGELVVDEQLVLSLAEVLARRKHNRFVELADGRFVGLSSQLQDQLLALEKASATTAKGATAAHDDKSPLRIPPLSLGFVSPWLRELSHGQLSFNRKAQERLARIDAAYKSTPQLPRTFVAELRPYQIEGFRFLSRVCEFGGGAILADDMGLGKTLMALSLLSQRGRTGPALIVAPLSLKRNWQEEASRFAPSLRLLRLDSGTDNLLADLAPFDVVVCSYGIMAQQIVALERIRFSTVVFDEAQAVKNPTAQRSRAARRILADARVALTGTPVENHLGDLHSLMTLCNPGLLGDLRRFEEQFSQPIAQHHDAAAAAALRALIAPFVLRRRKTEVLRELPARTEIVLEVVPDEAERAFNEALRRDAIRRLQHARVDADTSPVSILAEITRLRRAACHPCLADPHAGNAVGAAKIERLLMIAEDLRAEGHRALVFSQFVDFLQLVAARLDQAGFTYQYLDGSTSEAKRQQAVHAFQDGEGELFLISLKAGGFGLNLTAADYVVHLDPWWNPAVEAQASDRAHRIGQTRPVTIYKLVNAGSIEERVLALHGRKRELAEEILQDASTSTRLDQEALLALIADPFEHARQNSEAVAGSESLA